MNSDNQRVRGRGLKPRLLAGLVILVSLASFSAAEKEDRSDADRVFSQMAAAIQALHDYQAEWTGFTTTASEPAIWSRQVEQGKFLREPKLYWTKVLSEEANFENPVTPETQLFYDSRTDEVKALLSGLRRLLGVIHIFAEDVKCMGSYNGGLKTEGLWDQLADWRELREQGELSLRQESRQGKTDAVLSLRFAVESLGTRPHLNRYDLWVDPDDHLPHRVQGFVAGRDQPVTDSEFTRLQTNTGLGAQDVQFEGLALWNFPAQFVARAEGLDQVKRELAPPVRGAQAPSYEEVLDRFRRALSGVKDYRAELQFTEKYFRLKSRGRMTASVIREPFFFLYAFDPDFRINHLHFTAPGAKICYRRESNNIAALGGGAMRLVGVQVMHQDDPRTLFPFGEGLHTFTLFSLPERMEWYRRQGLAAVEMVSWQGKTCPRAMMKRKGKPRAGEIQDLAIIFDPQTWLPRRVEYLGNLDPDGFGAVDYLSLQVNLGLREEELKF